METGTLLHFPDSSRGLRTLYFLCPAWLAECLQRMLSLKSSRSAAANGLIRARDLRVGETGRASPAPTRAPAP